MTFILCMAWRDSRTARRRLALFSLSIVLGIAALVAIGSFGDNLRQAIDVQAKGLLGADVAVESRQPFSPEGRALLARFGGEQAQEISLASMVVFPGAGGQTRLVSVRGLAGAYPFYGEFLTAPSGGAALLARGDTAVVEETLLRQFGVKIGDPIKIGATTFTVAGALEKIPGEPAAVALLAPRVYVAQAALAATGLMGPGSLVNYKTYVKLAPRTDGEALAEILRPRFRDLRMRLDTVEQRKRELGSALSNVQAFLSLVGFIALFLGAIGVASAIHVHVRQKITTVAVLRCLGASARQSFGVYLVQGLALGLLGAVLGAALGVAVQLALPALVKGLLPFDVDFFVAWPTVLRGMLTGLVICGLFTLLPLLAVRRVSPLVALRSAFAGPAPGRDPWTYVIWAAIAAAVAGFAIWQTESWQTGLGFAGMLALSFGVLTGLARVVAWAARRFVPRRLPYVWRQGVANLHQPNNRTVLLLLSLGLGTFLLLTLALARETLLAEISTSGNGVRPNLLFFDIQDDQIGPLADLVAKAGAPLVAQAPIVTMKITSLKGRPVAELTRDATVRGPGWALRREYRTTYRAELTATEKLVAGTFTGRVAPDTAVVPVSLEEGIARDLQLAVGDELEFDVQGVPVKARVGSLRAVEWRQLSPNFFIVFPAGVLEAAPKFFVAAAHAASPADSTRLQQAVVQAFPNVSAIDLALVLSTLDGIFEKVQFVIQFMALFTVATGLVVLAGAVLSGRAQRVRETVLLRTLGASRRQLGQIQLVEYAALGLLASGAGGGLAYLANALLARYVFASAMAAPPGQLFAAMAVVTGLTVVTGLLANRGVTRQSPLAVLRQET